MALSDQHDTVVPDRLATQASAQLMALGVHRLLTCVPLRFWLAAREIPFFLFQLRIRNEISASETILKAYVAGFVQARPAGCGAGGLKQLSQVLMFHIKTDEDVPRRVSSTN
jgi:hypothetical protein